MNKEKSEENKLRLNTNRIMFINKPKAYSLKPKTTLRFKFLTSLSCLALICLSGCFFLSQSLKTLKSVGDSQEEIEIYLARQVDLFNKLLTDLNNRDLSFGISKDKFIHIYGEPILSKEVSEPLGGERLLYRHPTKYFQSDRIYIYFDEKERLTRWEYKPHK